MGTKYYVDVQTIRVVQDEDLPDLVKQSTISAVLQNVSIPDTIQQNVLYRSVVNDFNRYFNHGRDVYPRGLPNYKILGNDSDPANVKAAIEGEIGETITIDYARYTLFNYMHYAYKVLVENYGYDFFYNESSVKTAEKGFSVYVKNVIPVVFLPVVTDEGGDPVPEAEDGTRDAYAEVQWGESPASGYTPERPLGHWSTSLGTFVRTPIVKESQTEPAIEFYFIWKDDDGQIHEEMVYHPITDYDTQEEYFQVRYDWTDGQGDTQTGLWIYDPEDGTYPALEDSYTFNYTTPGTFFPIPFFWWFGTEVGGAEADANVDLLNILNIPYHDTRNQIRSAAAGSRIAQSGMVLGVRLNSDDPLDIDYLFRFFKQLYENSPDPHNIRLGPDEFRGNGFIRSGLIRSFIRRNVHLRYNMVIRDADWKINFTYEGTYRHVFAGQIGKIGTVRRGEHTNVSTVAKDENGNPRKVFRSVLYFDKQISLHTWERIEVVSPSMQVIVIEAKGKWINMGHRDGRFLIPLDKEICDQISRVKRDKLYLRALHIQVHPYQKHKEKWYEKGVFKAFLQIVMIAIAIFTFNPAALAGATLTAIATEIVIAIIGNIVFSYIGRLIAEKLGLEAAAIFTIITYAVQIGRMWGKAPALPGEATFADRLLQSSTNLVNGVEDFLMDEMKGLRADFAELTERNEALQDQIEQLKQELAPPVVLDPLLFVHREPAMFMGESPDAFYNRTVHVGNPGVQCYEILENYFSQSLTLPTVQDTLGGF